MSYQFKTTAVIAEAERLMELSEETGLMGCQIAQSLMIKHHQKKEHQQATFYRIIETYCYYMECCSHLVGNRYKQAFSAGHYCSWPHSAFLP